MTLVRNETQRHSAALKSAGQNPISLLPLNGADGLGREVVAHAADAGNLPLHVRHNRRRYPQIPVPSNRSTIAANVAT